MIPGRVYTSREVLAGVWRRKSLILLSLTLGTTVAVIVASRLPNRFRAETLILAAGQSMSADYVRTTVASDPKVKDSLPSISQQILSRPRLERIIQDLNLYPELRRAKPMEVVVEQMRGNIEIKTIEGSEAFRVAYEASAPVIATQVTQRLAGLFIEENSRDRTALAAQTSAFLESQLELARRRLVEQEKRLEAYRLKYGPELPTQLQSNIQVIQNTQAQLQALTEAINRDRDRRLLVARQIADLQSEQYLIDPSASANGSPMSPAAQLEAAQADLRALELRLTNQHPDLLRARQVVADLEVRMRNESAAASAETRPRQLSGLDLVRRNKVKELQAEMESLDRQVAAKVQEQSERREALDAYQRRVEAVPTRESELIAITRDYDTLQSIYRSLLTKKEDSKIAENLEQRQVIDQFKILDPPHQPQRPFSPNRPLIDLGGAVAGLVLGLLVVILLEYFDKRLHVEADLRAAIDVPMLAMIPAIITVREQRRARWRGAAVSAAFFTVFAGCATLVWLTFRI